ncbi:MAG: hypothetical protein FJX74_13990 [Armatimonadetes bacterium]|nr:hypothetical protein [Armatimonadota bacterium]
MTRKCVKCGTEARLGGAAFCTKCGGELTDLAVSPTPESPTSGPTAVAAPPVEPPEEEAPTPGLPCPYCQGLVNVPWPDRCPFCEQPLETRSLGELPPPPLALRVSDATALVVTLLLAVVLDVAVFRLVERLAPQGSLVRDMFLPEGLARSVPIAITFLFVWCILQAIWRTWAVWAHRRYPGAQLRSDWLQTLRAGRIPRDPASLERLRGRALRRSWWVGRLSTAVAQWMSTRNPAQVGEAIERHSALDADAVRSNHSLLRLAIWAMPILGFIGTVVGITLAVQAFSRFLGGEVNDVEAVRKQLMDVTRGLSYAFLTTMHGLVAALVAMFVASIVEKAEGDALTEADRYALEELVPAIAYGARARSQHGDDAALAEVLERLDQLSEQMSRLTPSAP